MWRMQGVRRFSITTVRLSGHLHFSFPVCHTEVMVHTHNLTNYIWVKLSKKVRELQCTQVLTGCAW